MCGKLWGKIMTFVLALLIIMPACAMTGCSGSKEPDNKTSVDYTVVENADLPEELKKLIESKKDKVMRLTYTTKDYTYVVAGYGTRETSGYRNLQRKADHDQRRRAELRLPGAGDTFQTDRHHEAVDRSLLSRLPACRKTERG